MILKRKERVIINFLIIIQEKYELKKKAKKSDKWVSSKKSVAIVRVKKNGAVLITARKKGTAYLVKKVRGKEKKRLKIEVKNKGYLLKTKSAKLFLNEVEKLRGKFTGIKNKKLKYSSSKPSIVAVNKEGIIKGKKEGTAVITVTASTGYIQKCTVKVKKGYCLSFEKPVLQLKIGDKEMNSAKKSKSFQDTIKYKSSNPSVAGVDSRGMVSAFKQGTAVITAEGTQDKASYKVNISDEILSSEVRFIAHRGWHEKYTENSMEAFQAAIDSGYWGIETDIRVTKDGIFVLSHDDNLWSRNLFVKPSDLTDEKEIEGNISELTYEQVKKLTSGKIVMLEELLEFLQDKKEIPLLELKSVTASGYPSEEEIKNMSGETPEEKQIEYSIEKLLKLISKYNFIDRCYITSFDKALIEKVREKNSDIKIQYITSERNYDLEYLKKYRFGLDWYFRRATKEAVQELLENHINVCLWTLDDKQSIKEAMSWGINTITTNKHLFTKK